MEEDNMYDYDGEWGRQKEAAELARIQHHLSHLASLPQTGMDPETADAMATIEAALASRPLDLARCARIEAERLAAMHAAYEAFLALPQRGT
jgi:hypothetical protein